MLRSRLTKMVAKNIGVLYYGLPLSNDPRSALYGNIGGTDELDVMTEYFEPHPAPQHRDERAVQPAAVVSSASETRTHIIHKIGVRTRYPTRRLRNRRPDR